MYQIRCISNKTAICFSLFIILSIYFQEKAFSVPTKWERVETSLSDLLNSGWQLAGVASNRAAYKNSISPGGLDETEYIFSITKNGKYMICVMSNPTPPIAPAGCRRIN
jgi:hypothetical protein